MLSQSVRERSHAYSSIIEATELPRLVRLRANLYAAVFGVMKLLPARFMIDRAEDRGLLTPDTTVIETSSGTFGLGLAMVCGMRGYRVVIVGDPAIDANLQRRMRGLGAEVEIVDTPSAAGGYQGARLERVAQLKDRYADHYVPGQYDNVDNPAAYAGVAELISDCLGPIDCLVGPVGSGGSTGGLASFLRLGTPEMSLVGVDTHGSVIFGMPDRPRLVRGLGNSLVPPNVRHAAYDEVHWVGAEETFRATHDLHSTHCLFMGPTSGAAYLVADRWAVENPDATTVVVFPDEGNRYQETVYSEDWLRDNGVWPLTPQAGPTHVEHPGDVAPTWSWMSWARRELTDVLPAAAAR
ncbi:cysteine synthase family protein [Amycolatopsis sp. cmx-11-51]|uniref:cysteine synthase family protein n=1 Tax=unclassified Amycolatopsis TaxID=2618356 RepID=UPI0039E39334